MSARDRARELSDADFEAQKGAIKTKIAIKDTTIMKTAKRFMEGEIGTHRYNFNRQQEDLETIDSITKEEF